MIERVRVSNINQINKIVNAASSLNSDVGIHDANGQIADAKSLLGVLSLGIVGGTTIRIIADGADEQAAVDALIKLVESGFAE